jgi:transcriptional regulator GlxA family with amidase domain
MMSVACTLDPMRAANRIAANAVFEWKILTLDGRPVTLTCGLPIPADAKFGEAPANDILIIIAGFDSQLHARRDTIARLAKSASLFRTIGGVDAGSWLMARAGLLNGHRATTHWEDLEDFAGDFPDIDVIANRYVVDGHFFTTGGASATIDLMLHLIRSRKGVPLAMQVANVFTYDEIHMAAEAQNLVSLGRLDSFQPKIAAAIKIMEARIDEPVLIQSIADTLKMSIRALEMLFHKTVQISPGKFYRHLRLQAARRMIIDTRLSIQQIAVRTGFGSASAFSRAFKVHFGQNPTRIRHHNH